MAAQREGETALLAARGATRWQLTRLTAAEVIPLTGLTALAGGVAGIWLARLLGGSLYGAGAGAAGGGISSDRHGYLDDALAARSSWPCSRPARCSTRCCAPGAGSARVRRGRQAALASATRAGADLGLIVLAVLAGWQLRRYSAVSTAANGAPAAIDPVLALAPALALAGGTVLTLRLLPAAARAADRLAAGGRGLTGALAAWQFSRQPLRQGGAALLLVMAVATGTLALAQHQSWNLGPPPTRRRSRQAPTCGWTWRTRWPPARPPAQQRRRASPRHGGHRRQVRCPPGPRRSIPPRHRRPCPAAATSRRCRQTPLFKVIAPPARGRGNRRRRGTGQHPADRHAEPRRAGVPASAPSPAAHGHRRGRRVPSSFPCRALCPPTAGRTSSSPPSAGPRSPTRSASPPVTLGYVMPAPVHQTR